MGLFFKITYEARYAGSFESNVKQIKVLDYIIDNMNNMNWQLSISNQLQKVDRHHISLSIILRMFDIKHINEGNLKSYARYTKKEDSLHIDQMLALNDYVNLQEDEMRSKLCDDIFVYLKEMLIKYKDRFQDFDSIKFITILEERFNKIKNNEFEDDFYNTEGYKHLKQAEEIKKKNANDIKN